MVILITGISSGFGQAMAARLSKDGHKVYGTYRNAPDRLPGVTYLQADVLSADQIQAAVSQVMESEGRIDVFINNAGMGIGGPLEHTAIEDSIRQMDVNFMGMVRCMNQIVPIMRNQGHGLILCLSSIGGLMGLPYQGMYSASKFAIEGYCQALRIELRGTGVNVCVINPGDFHTSFTSSRKCINPETVRSTYPGYASALKSIEHDEHSGLTPERLARRISRIVTRRHPRARYIIASPVQKASVFIKAIIPARWFDSILALYYR